jgi:hypothetical protein
VHALEIEEMVTELGRLRGELSRDDIDFETASGRLVDLVREIHRNREVFNGTDLTLAEEASEIKLLGRKVERPMPQGQPTAVPA